MGISKILVPTDFSVESISALELAHKIAFKNGAEVCLLHIDTIDKKNQQNRTDEYEKLIKQESLIRLDRIATSKKFDDAKIWVKQLVIDASSSVPQKVVEVAKDLEIDLILLATKRQTAMVNVLGGSISHEVLGISSCPVILIPPHYDTWTIHNIAFVSNFYHVNNHISVLKGISDVFDCKFHLMNLNHSSESQEVVSRISHRIQDFAKFHGMKNNQIHDIHCETAEAGILNFTDQMDMDLVVIDSIKNGLLFPSLGEPSARILLDKIYKPILIL